MMDEDETFTLADLSDLDVSDVQEIRYESLPAGVYGFKVVSAGLDEKPNRDNEQRFIAEFKFEIVEVKAVVKKGVDPDSLIGKQHTEKLYIVPAPQDKALEGIGRIRAFITDLGLESKGKLGEVVESTVGHTFYGKIVEQKDKNDKSIVYARLKLDPAK